MGGNKVVSVFMSVYVGAIRNVIAFSFQKADHVVLELQEILGSVPGLVGAIERNCIGPRERVKGESAPGIVCLISVDARIEEKIRFAPVIPHDENNVGLRP